MSKTNAKFTGQVDVDIYDANGNLKSQDSVSNNVSTEFLRYAMSCFTDYVSPQDGADGDAGVGRSITDDSYFAAGRTAPTTAVQPRFRSNTEKPVLGAAVTDQQWNPQTEWSYTGGFEDLAGYPTDPQTVITGIEITGWMEGQPSTNHSCIMEDIGGGITKPTDYSFRMQGRIRDTPYSTSGSFNFTETRFGVIKEYKVHAGSGDNLTYGTPLAIATIDAEVRHYDTLIVTWTITINAGT